MTNITIKDQTIQDPGDLEWVPDVLFGSKNSCGKGVRYELALQGWGKVNCSLMFFLQSRISPPSCFYKLYLNNTVLLSGKGEPFSVTEMVAAVASYLPQYPSFIQ